MNPVPTGLAAAGVLAATGAAVALVLPARWRSAAVGVATAGVGAAGAAAGVAAVSGHGWRAEYPDVLPLAGVSLAVDPLAGWFLLLTGAVAVVVGVYAIGYAGRGGHGPGARGPLALLPVFVAAMLLVPAAADVPTFLLAWELTAVTSLLLVLVEHRHGPAVLPAGLWYAVMTQAGFVTILIGLVWLAAAAGDPSFAAIQDAAGGLSGPVRGGVFVLCVAGFAAKAGAVPLHPWLPRAHAEAPAHVSALMSAAMVKLGVYGIVRLGFDLLGGGPRWWWLALGAVGMLSALYGILQAAVATDLKKLLAFSTSENVGLILLGLAAAGLLASAGQPAVAAVALAAALLHAANHAGFKALLFCGAGSVLRGTGVRDLDRLGGLSRRMPATTALVCVGALGAAALPLGNGFVSEWLLLQALLHQATDAGTLWTVVAPVAVAVVALTAGVGVATFVKVVGTGFLARPRGEEAAAARESPPSMVAGMVLAAAACCALAVLPALAGPALDRVTAGLRAGPRPFEGGAVDLRLAGVGSTIAPLWIAAGVVGLAVATAVMARLAGRPRRRAAAWDCGDGPLTARMEYTATSFAEPLQRVFDDVLAPEQDVDVTPAAESAYLVRSVQYRRRLPDRIEARLYRPLIAAVEVAGRAARGLATGSVHRYLAYMLAALILVLFAAAVR
ncbi:proton-conducting transporter membrane subunit [Phytohabitans sp. ZYX-F-186]|uniref:Proton-conducting transporter membrane subunit n=1 Tax=Phytohabitans maris TaxID=3071409 RepID=A0ABU0ZAM0_9ACTN|nr:proton-conducting transporter membrane subunit [Phytohabitans sp. ZYX-F-186]MDQ7904028.1 proton-conducting transporter membrane subunit [Phytohabitans sp. ZYX-F-186]